MSNARGKPFVAWVHKAHLADWPNRPGPRLHPTDALDSGRVPAVVTPLLESDPKPGEVWEEDERSGRPGNRVEIL